MSHDTARYSPQHHISKQGKVRLNFHLFHLISFLFIYFSIKQCLNYFIQLHQCTKYVNNNMIFFHENGLIIFLLFLMGKIRLVYVLFGSPRI
jgi:hypothetical protein